MEDALMEKSLGGVTKHLLAGMLVAVALVWVSSLAIHAPDQKSAIRSLLRIQTDKATLFYAEMAPKANWFVEQVLP